MELEQHPDSDPIPSSRYDPVVPSSILSEKKSSNTNQLITSLNPAAFDMSTHSPHDIFCLAKEYDRSGNHTDAANLYLKASMNGHLSAMVSYAHHLVQLEDQRAAFVWYRAAAERGDPRAWTELGRLLAIGRYFEVNAVDAARCWKRAAQMGDNIGKSSLGVCYVRGFGVRQDIDKGIEIMKQVAQVHNDVTAMINLAWIYSNGKFVQKDLQQAEYWQKRAKQREKEMRQFSLKERALFGKSRSSRHTKSKTDIRDTAQVTTNTSSVPPKQNVQIISDDDNYKSKDDNSKSLAFAQDLGSRLEEIQRTPSDEHIKQQQQTEISPKNHEQPSTITEIHKSTTSIPLKEKVSTHIQNEQTMRTDSFQNEKDSTYAANTATISDTIAQTEAKNREIFEDLECDDDVKYVKEEIVRPDPDPVLKAELSTLGFKPNTESRQTTVTNMTTATTATTSQKQQSDFDIADSEIQTVQETAAAAVPQQKPVTLVSQQITQSTSPVVDLGTRKTEINLGESQESQAPSSHTGTVEDQFQTPDQSLLNEEIELRKESTPLFAVGVGRAATTNRFDTHTSQSILSRQSDAEVNPTIEEARNRFESASKDVRQDLNLSKQTGHNQTTNLFTTGNEEANPYQNVSSRKALESSEFIAGAAIGSYALSKAAGTGSDQERDVVDEYQDQTINNASEPIDNATWHQNTNVASASDLVPCKITRASSFAKGTTPKTSAVTTATTTTTTSAMQEVEETEKKAEFVDASEIATEKDGEPKIKQLEELLSLYPTNPLRSDSQVPLFKLLKAIQQFPLSETEAYNTLETGNGYSKVIVAMICQIEDEHLQEQGLHSFVRIVRATPSPHREARVLSSYSDCYRAALGDRDAVIPKGSVSIDERSSGGIQAVVHSMKLHESVRRIQLAGCAAVAEIAAISPSCRQIAYEYGVVSLILSCLRHRSSQAASTIHDISCRAVGSFCSGRENFAFKEAFTNAGVIPELLNILQLWGHSEDVKSDLLTTVTKSCCAAIRHVTDGCGVASAQCVQSFAYHHLVRVMVLRRDDVTICTLAVSALTSITRNAGSIAEKGLLDAKPLNEVLQTMQTHSQNPAFLRKSLDFMESLGGFNSMKEELVKAGGIPFSASIIQKAGNDSVLLERASGVVEKLCRTNPKNQESFASSNGVKSLTSLLRSHHSVPGVAERALLALTSVCANNPQNQRESIEANTPEYVVRVLAAYSAKNTKVTAAACSAMSALVISKNGPVAQVFADLKAPELVIEAMKKHPDSVAVQENGSAAIAGLCESDPRIIPSLQNSGITSILVVALQRFLHCQTAVIQIVRAMRAIINEACPEDSYRFKSKLLTDRSNESTLSEIFHTALSYHKKSLPDTANVIISICATINCLCMRSVAFKNEVGKDGIVEELKRLVEKTAQYRDLGALQPVLATICTLVLESEDNKNRFHTVGGVEAILGVMQKWKTDTFVLEHCCAALRYSCNDHFGNCDEAKNHNGVRSVLGVMELHPENVNVTLWCCLTLADLCKGDEELQSSPNVKQGIRTVVSAMNMFSSNSKFLASACEFLRAASVDNDDNKERIVRLGGRTAIVKALEAHPRDNALTEAGAYALLQIQDIPDPRASVDSAQPLSIVKRFSREMRRSSNTTRNSKGKEGSRGGFLGLKSRSFTRRRTAESNNEGDDNSGQRSSFLRFTRNRSSRFRGRRDESHEEDDFEEDDDEELDDDYDDYEPDNQSEGSEE